LDSFNGLQRFLHGENFFLFSEHFEEHEPGRGAGIRVHIVQPEAGLDVAAVLRKEFLNFGGFGQTVGDLDSQYDPIHMLLLSFRSSYYIREIFSLAKKEGFS
jgi:hypothetical protein